MDHEAPTGSALSNLLSNPQDAAAQERFVADYGPSILQWCRTLCPQPADADDLYQTVWCKLLEQMRTFRYDPGRGRFRGWLRTVARNTWINMVKSIKPIAFGGPRTIDETCSDWEKMIDEFWDRELFMEAVRRVRPRLNAGTWEAFELNAFEGRAAAEVAQLTGKSVASIHVLKGRVTRMLQDEIARLDRSDEETRDRT
jgi:RNA polymerase sigma-70 factor (ECF subfamily)